MPKAKLGDAEIYYESHGSGEPLLLVSGLGGAAAYWTANLPAFSARYRTIVHDHRGAGQSTHSEGERGVAVGVRARIFLVLASRL